MGIFLLLSAPLFYAFVVSLPWPSDPSTPSVSARRVRWVVLFFTGTLLFIPCFIAVAIVRRVTGFAYDPPFLLFLSQLVRYHLPLRIAGAVALLAYLARYPLPRAEGGLFLSFLAFWCGFDAASNGADFVANWGAWDLHSAVLLPLIRLAEVMALSRIVGRYPPRDRKGSALFLVVASAISVLFSLLSFLFLSGWREMATALTACVAAGVLLESVSAYGDVFGVRGIP